MGFWSTTTGRSALTAGLSTVLAMGVALPAFAQTDAQDHRRGTTNDWGTVVPDGGCAQGDAWLLRAQGLFGAFDMPVFEAHAPTISGAFGQAAGGDHTLRLQHDLGDVSAASTQTLRNMVRTGPGAAQPSGGPDCSMYSEAATGKVDLTLGLPNLLHPTSTQRAAGYRRERLGKSGTGITLHADALDSWASAQPGRPAQFFSSAAGLNLGLTIAGVGTEVAVDPQWPVNAGVNLGPLAKVTTNEQVQTDAYGNPVNDPTASSGYVNGVHISLLGTDGADITYAHAAVIQNGTVRCMSGARCTATGH